jgi:two-component system, LytTR family, sensor kinase
LGQSGRCTVPAIRCIVLRPKHVIGYDFVMDGSLTPAGSYRWLWIFCVWLGFGLVDATQTVVVMRAEGMHHAWLKLFFTEVVEWLPWALATSPVMQLAERFPVPRKRIANWLVHIAACATVGLMFSAWIAWLDLALNPYASPGPPKLFTPIVLNHFSNGIVSFLVLYTAILAVNYGLDSRARLANQQAETARLNEQLSKTQLDALRSQIEPHFLFNSLNGVAGLVREGRNDDAVSMIAELSDFLRRVLEDSKRQRVPLREEIEFAQRYLDIQKVRFAERLKFTVDVPEELYRAQVPSLILQPMVENAIKHGIAKRAQGGAVRIAASRGNGMLTISVYNDGPSLPVESESQPGIGMSNVRTRLQGLYGDAFELSLENQPPGGVQVSVSVPYKETA